MFPASGSGMATDLYDLYQIRLPAKLVTLSGVPRA